MHPDKIKIEQNMLLFMHIPKTAGTTLDTIIEKQYTPENIVNLNSSSVDITFENKNIESLLFTEINKKPAAKGVIGHFRFGMHEYFTDKKCSYIAFLRNPVDQYISQYDYAARLDEFPDIKRKVFHNNGITGFINSEISYYASNMQTYFLSGETRENLLANPNLCLEKAKENLIEQFTFFGLQEFFNLSLILLQTHFNWRKYPYYKSKKVRGNKLKKEDLDNNIISRIKEINHMDIELYSFAHEIFLKKYKNIFSLKTQKFILVNSIKNLIDSQIK